MIAPHAQRVQAEYGVPASIVIAQAALESGWGDSIVGNNVMNIKKGESWRGPTTNFATHEVIGGERIAMHDDFRAYDSIRESCDDYGELMMTRDYASVRAADNAYEAADALQYSGYATDEDYALKLKQIIAQNDLTRFDDERYQDYTNTDFEATRTRLRTQREERPEIWEGFMGFIQLIVNTLAGLCGLTGGDEQTNTPPPAPQFSSVTQVQAGATRVIS